MRSIEQLIQDSDDPRLERQPKFVRQLIAELAYRLKLEATAAESARRNAEKEVGEARALAMQGPENADTFMNMPNSFSTYADDYEQKPLGTGTGIEFRDADMEAGDGISAKFEPRETEDGRIRTGRLKIHGLNRLAVVPESPTVLYIEILEGD